MPSRPPASGTVCSIARRNLTRRKPTAWSSASTAVFSAKCWASPSTSHQDLETLLAGFNAAYNGRRQRVLKGRSPDVVLRERLKAKPELAKPVTKPPDPNALPKALKVVADAKEVSHPDTPHHQRAGRDGSGEADLPGGAAASPLRLPRRRL